MGVFYQRMRASVERVVLLYPVQILAVFALSVVGGLLNRMRGGWAPYDRAHCEATNHVLSVLCHDGVDRAIISGPTGLLVGLCMMRWRRGATVAIGFAVLTYFSFFVGWGVYFSLGEDADQYKSRVGCFDWLVGRTEPDWTLYERWSLDVVAMSLRGLLQTAPTGLLLLLYGYGWMPLASGVMMGPLYTLGNNIPSRMKNFTEGSQVGEFLWGFWMWATLLTALLALHRPRSQRLNTMESARTPPPLTRGASFVLHVVLLALDAVFVLSCVSYGMLKQKDPRNKAQTLLGLAVCTAALLAFHLVLVVWQCSRRRKEKESMYSYQSPINADSGDDAADGLYGSMASGPSDSLLHAGRDVEDTGTRVKASDMRLFAQRDVPSEETIKGTWAVHAVLCVPPDRSRADSADTTAVSGASSACVTPLGSLLLLFTFAIVLWSAAFLVLLVWNVAKNSHHFGCVPYVECTEGPWPSS